MSQTYLVKLFLLSFVVVSIGCGGGGASDAPELSVVEGTVRYKGQPLGGASVSFVPEGGRPATGMTDDNGHFTLTTTVVGDGATIGSHAVMITKLEAKDSNETDIYAEQKSLIPKKYGDLKKSGLTATVKSDEKNNFTFDLEE